MKLMSNWTVLTTQIATIVLAFIKAFLYSPLTIWVVLIPIILFLLSYFGFALFHSFREYIGIVKDEFYLQRRKRKD